MWKDKVLTHVSQLDLEYQRSLLEKDQPDAKVLMKDFLLGSPAEPGHYKKDCPVLKSDRDPNRSGGPIFRTDVNTVPGGKRAKTGKVTKIGAVVSKTMGTPEINRAIEEDAAAAAAREMFNESDIEMSPSSELDALELTVPDTP
ncbi:hypothetical protein P43SY_006613 [Pythium insidiosum]|uniref:Uncharacterized protein n=1 Tax=Pythium insidiosum TaxID=114742 RepID=A0AAD5M1F9_PYTIN|nr:hypothetical protein P43SY_006613 [Pythium insidiosum]